MLLQTIADSDGVIPIDQECAVTTGCFAGDGPGLPVTITAPGSSRLTGEISAAAAGASNVDGIEIQTDDVFLDLNGFALVGPGAGEGIQVTGTFQGILIRNGVVRDWDDEGINASLARHSRFQDLVVLGNDADGLVVGNDNVIFGVEGRGNGADGIDGSVNTVVKDCLALENGDNGIEVSSASVVESSVSRLNTNDGSVVGVGSVVRGSAASSDGTAGIDAGDGTLIVDNAVLSNGAGSTSTIAGGVEVDTGARVFNNTVRLNSRNGIVTSGDGYIRGNTADGNGLSGILVRSTDVRVDSNHATDNGRFGIESTLGQSLFIRSSGSGNVSGEYSFSVLDQTGPIVSDPSATANPRANFDFRAIAERRLAARRPSRDRQPQLGAFPFDSPAGTGRRGGCSHDRADGGMRPV